MTDVLLGDGCPVWEGALVSFKGGKPTVVMGVRDDGYILVATCETLHWCEGETRTLAVSHRPTALELISRISDASDGEWELGYVFGEAPVAMHHYSDAGFGVDYRSGEALKELWRKVRKDGAAFPKNRCKKNRAGDRCVLECGHGGECEFVFMEG